MRDPCDLEQEDDALWEGKMRQLLLKGGNKMKHLLFGAMLFALVIVVPIPTMAAVNINVNISLPPPIVFEAPPEVVVIPDTDDVYVDPDIDVDLFFWNGWWWRLWEGRWYRSQYYNQGWVYYDNVPSFYFDVDPDWRGYYRNHDWHGHPLKFLLTWLGLKDSLSSRSQPSF